MTATDRLRVGGVAITAEDVFSDILRYETSGPPTTGTYVAGNFCGDLAGQLWICVTGGTPGTWQAVGAGRELGYAEITSNHSVTGVGLSNRTDVTGLTVTFTPTDRPLIIETFLRYALIGDGTLANTTVAAGSNGVDTSTFAGAGTLNVASASGYQTTGELEVATGTTNARVRYTGTTGTSFTGCTTLYGGGVMSTGGAVQASPLNVNGHGGLGIAITENDGTPGTIVADSLTGAFYGGAGGGQPIKGPTKHFAAGVLTEGVAVTYKIQAYCVNLGPHRIAAGAASPAYMLVREL